MGRCFIDVATCQGMKGWAIGSQVNQPCRLRIETGGRVVARAVARTFRRDLLRAGVGHGHYGFTARFAEPLPPGAHLFAIFEQDGQTPLPGNGREPFTLEPRAGDAVMPLEELLERVDRWTEPDMVRHVGLLKLDANMAAMGVARFVDVTCHYLLGRWPDGDSGMQQYETALRDGQMTPEEFFLALLLSGERAATRAVLAAPYDARFPYDLS